MPKRLEQEIQSISVPSTSHKAVESWLKNESLTIGSVLRDPDAKQILLNTVSTQLVDFVSLLSTTGLMTAEKIYRITQEFFKNKMVANLNIHELKFFLSECTSMQYGKVYHGFGLDVLMDWFEKYWEIRERDFEDIQETRRMEFSASEKASRPAPYKLQSVGGNSNNGQELPDYNTVGEILKNLNDTPGK